MLSQSAWNAFLKTLEEPPPHVKFIFATTEVQKVPVTILSRVQRFDFKLIPTQLIAKRLAHVLSAEGIKSDERGLSVIAREAAGSMRDAMSLLDQVIAWNDQNLDGDSVARVLGVASRQILHDLARALVAGDAARCLSIVGELSNQGYDIATVARDALAVLRDLVVSKVCKEPGDLLDLADEERKDVATLAEQTSLDDLVRLHQGFSAGFDDVVRSGQVRAALEMLLVRLARRPALIPIDDLVTRLAALEKRLGGAAPRGPAGPPSGRPSPTRPDPRSSPPPGTRQQSREAAPSGPPEASAAAATDEPPPAPNPPSRANGAPTVRDLGPVTAAVVNGNAFANPTAVPTAEGTLEIFRSIVARVRATRPELAACLHHAAIIDAGPERLALAFEAGTIFERTASAPDALELLRAAAREVFGVVPPIVLETRAANAAQLSVSAVESQERSERKREALARAKQHPKIAEASRILGARLKEIRLPEE
jgi:DNA polymerase-3 subunit gamma/tau